MSRRIQHLCSVIALLVWATVATRTEAQSVPVKRDGQATARADGECSQAVANVSAAGNLTLIACPKYAVELTGVIGALSKLELSGRLQRGQLQQVIDSVNAVFAVLLRRESETAAALGKMEKSVRAMSDILERRLGPSSDGTDKDLVKEVAGLKSTYEEVLAEWRLLKADDPLAAKVYAALERFDLESASKLIEESLGRQKAGLAARHRSLAQVALVRGDSPAVRANYAEAVRLEPLKYGIEFIELMLTSPLSFGSPKSLVQDQVELWRAHAAKNPAYDPTARLRVLEIARGYTERSKRVELELEELSVLKRAYNEGDRRFARRLTNALIFDSLPGEYFPRGTRSQEADDECIARARASTEAIAITSSWVPDVWESAPAARLRVATQAAEQLDSCEQSDQYWRSLEQEIDRSKGDRGDEYALSRALFVLARHLERRGRIEIARQRIEQRHRISSTSGFEKVSALIDAGDFHVRHRLRSIAYQRYMSAVELMRQESVAQGTSAILMFSAYSAASLRASTLAIASRSVEKAIEEVDRFHSEHRELISSQRSKVSSSDLIKAPPSIEEMRADFLMSLVSRPNWLEREGDRDGGCMVRYFAAKMLRIEVPQPGVFDPPDFCEEARR